MKNKLSTLLVLATLSLSLTAWGTSPDRNIRSPQKRIEALHLFRQCLTHQNSAIEGKLAAVSRLLKKSEEEKQKAQIRYEERNAVRKLISNLGSMFEDTNCPQTPEKPSTVKGKIEAYTARSAQLSSIYISLNEMSRIVADEVKMTSQYIKATENGALKDHEKEALLVDKWATNYDNKQDTETETEKFGLKIDMPNCLRELTNIEKN